MITHMIPDALHYIGANIRRARGHAQMTQRQLGLAIGYRGDAAVISVNRFERSRMLPRLERLHAISRITGVELADLVDPNYA